jgi:hypothetical protein
MKTTVSAPNTRKIHGCARIHATIGLQKDAPARTSVTCIS